MDPPDVLDQLSLAPNRVASQEALFDEVAWACDDAGQRHFDSNSSERTLEDGHIA